MVVKISSRACLVVVALALVGAPRVGQAEQSQLTDPDRRLRAVVLSRFGVRGTAKATTVDFPLAGSETLTRTPSTTFGFDIRLEKPVHRYLSVGGGLSNYWIRSGQTEYALDASALVKPRYAFPIRQRESEVYLAVQIGGSLLVNKVTTVMGFGGDELRSTMRNPSGGFNVSVAPGFQVFVAENVAVVTEVGYAYSWFRIKGPLLRRLSIGQATIRVGLAFAF